MSLRATLHSQTVRSNQKNTKLKNYLKKLEEAQYNLDNCGRNFNLGDQNFIHDMNNFLSSIQAVVWNLNKTFNPVDGYKHWSNSRSFRLPKISKTFKELRNISLKEEPIKHDSVIVKLDFGAKGITIPPNATVVSPWYDTKKGKLSSTKATITLESGEEYEVEPLIIHDFSVRLKKDKVIFEINNFLSNSIDYINAMRKEIEEAENNFQIK